MTTTRQARNSHFQRGSAVFTCRSCGRKARDTGDNGQLTLCTECFELSGYTNSLSDRGSLDVADLRTIQGYLDALIDHVGGDKVRAAFPELTQYWADNAPRLLQQAQPTPEALPAPAADAAEWFVWVTGPEAPEYPMLVEAPNSQQARRVAKRIVEKTRTLDGLSFRAEPAV